MEKAPSDTVCRGDHNFDNHKFTAREPSFIASDPCQPRVPCGTFCKSSKKHEFYYVLQQLLSKDHTFNRGDIFPIPQMNILNRFPLFNVQLIPHLLFRNAH